MRHCNYSIPFYETKEVCEFIGNDHLGRPVYECTNVETVTNHVPCIVDTKSFSIDRNSAINLATNEITVVSQDNPFNKEKFKVNSLFKLMGANWKVINVDLTKNGLLVLTCEKVA